jgi:hypothetical protein
VVKRLVARELTLSFVPDAEQRLWRTVTRKKYQLRCDRVRLQNQLESLLEEAHIKLSSLVTDLLGVSARRMLKALADRETKPTVLAALADQGKSRKSWSESVGFESVNIQFAGDGGGAGSGIVAAGADVDLTVGDGGNGELHREARFITGGLGTVPEFC